MDISPLTTDTCCSTLIIKGERPDYRKQGQIFLQAWPSNGTFVRKLDPSPADTRYVGLNLSDDLVERSKFCKKEDEFAERLRLIGAQIWEDEESAVLEDLGEWEPERMRKYCQSISGWPSSGKGSGSMSIIHGQGLSRGSCWVLCGVWRVWMSSVLFWKMECNIL
ncbi:hypothetical protein BDV11DRAFT_173424 [Aspergillus similis]